MRRCVVGWENVVVWWRWLCVTKIAIDGIDKLEAHLNH